VAVTTAVGDAVDGTARGAPAALEGRVVVTTRSFGSGGADPEGLLAAAGLEVVRADPGHDPAALAGPLAGAVAWIAGVGPIGAAQLHLASDLRVVARYGVGVDAVDRAELARRGVVLTNTPDANAATVADFAVLLMLAALRQLPTTLGGTMPPALASRELGQLTVGVIGFGRIGRSVARRLAGFGARVLAHDPLLEVGAPLPDGLAGEAVALDELAARCEVLTLHAPALGRPLVDAALLARVRPGVVLVNAARAELVDDDALAAALADGRVAVAALDAHDVGPGSPLAGRTDVLLTPHVAGQSRDSVDRMGMGAAEDVLRVLRGEAPRHPVPQGS
jgi:D-3-phosphoglycerate dehydrogenase